MRNGQSRQHCQERLGLRLDCLGQQPAGATPLDGGQRILGLVGPPEWDNCAKSTQRL
jgi:hypothetical protein